LEPPEKKDLVKKKKRAKRKERERATTRGKGEYLFGGMKEPGGEWASEKPG